MKKILIIGGMGPQASIYLHQKIVSEIASRGSKSNDEYPLIIHISVPVPDFISGEAQKKDAEKMLREELGSLNGIDFTETVIACNTAHLLLGTVEDIIKSKFVSLVDETIESISSKEVRLVGLLATPTTIKTKLYENKLINKGIEALVPSDSSSKELEFSIRRVIAGEDPATEKSALEKVVKELRANGAKKIILGCTELSLIAEGSNQDFLIDPLAIVAKKIAES